MWIVTSANPLLVAARVNTQAEFDRTFRAVVKAEDCRNKKLLFISCLNIDSSPQEDQLFPLTRLATRHDWQIVQQAPDDQVNQQSVEQVPEEMSAQRQVRAYRLVRGAHGEREQEYTGRL